MPARQGVHTFHMAARVRAHRYRHLHDDETIASASVPLTREFLGFVLRPNCVYTVRDIKPRNGRIHQIICHHRVPCEHRMMRKR